MKEKSIKSNIVWMIAVVFIGISSIVLIGCINNNIWKKIFGIIFLVSIVVTMINITGIIIKMTFNKTLINLPYGFDYEAEFMVYKNIGRVKKRKIIKSLKSDIQIPKVYTEWKNQLASRYNNIIDNENFYHFIRRRLRNLKKTCELFAAVIVPIEIAIMTIIPTDNGSQVENFWGLLGTVVALAITLTREYYKYKDETEFTTDVIEVLCPKFSKNKE